MDYIFTAITIILAGYYLGYIFLKKNIFKNKTIASSCNKCSGCSESCSRKNI